VACFNGGNFILGGLTLNEPAYTQFGLALVDGCHETYAATATGIGPEIFAWQDSRHPLNATNNPPAPPTQAAFYNASGFWIANGNYVLRPEVVESYYYAYRATGDVKYQDWAWEAFVAVNKTCRVGSGYSSIRDVNQPGGGGFHDFQESFWFAEVLKYSYLIHAEVSFRDGQKQRKGRGISFEGRVCTDRMCDRMLRGRSRPTIQTSLCTILRRIQYGWPRGRRL
jgi:mannosyl-oligosaccharide alpha-1,2-mannosidase